MSKRKKDTALPTGLVFLQLFKDPQRKAKERKDDRNYCKATDESFVAGPH